MVLLASRAAARACQCWRLLPEKPTQAELRSFLGLLKACYNSYFHTCLKFRTHHGYKCGTAYIIHPLVRWSSILPPLLPPGLGSLVAYRVAADVKKTDGAVDAQGIGQDLEEMYAEGQGDDSWQNGNQRSPKRHFCNRIRVVNLTKLLTHCCKHCKKKPIVDSKTRSKMWTIWSAVKKSTLRHTPKNKFWTSFCFWARSSSKWGD